MQTVKSWQLNYAEATQIQAKHGKEAKAARVQCLHPESCLRKQAKTTMEGLAAKSKLNAKTRKQGDNDNQDNLFDALCRKGLMYAPLKHGGVQNK